MIHARPDYQAIQPWPTHRPHIVKDAAGAVIEVKGTHDRGIDAAVIEGTIAPLIPDDEPVFLIRGQDAAALPAIATYLAVAEAIGAAPDLLDCIREHVARVEAWQAERRVKVPDLPAAVPAWPAVSRTDDPGRLT